MEKVVINIDKCSKVELIESLNAIKVSDEPRKFELNINEANLTKQELLNNLIQEMRKNI